MMTRGDTVNNARGAERIIRGAERIIALLLDSNYEARSTCVLLVLSIIYQIETRLSSSDWRIGNMYV